MQRPVVLVGFTFLFTLIAALLAGFGLCVVMGVFLLLVAAVFILLKVTINRRTIAAILLVSALGFGYFAAKIYLEVRPCESLDGMSAKISGQIVEEPEISNGRFLYQIKTESVSGKNVPQNIKFLLVSKNKVDANAFDKITADVVFYKQDNNKTDSFASQKIYIRAYLDAANDSLQITQTDKKPLYYKAILIRRHMRNAVKSVLHGNEAALVNGIVLGDLSDMGENIIEDFRICGLSHIMAVSGMHLAVILHFLMWALSFFKIKKRAIPLIAIPVVVTFMAVTGFSPSILRAGIVCIIYLVGLSLMRKPDALNSLSAAVLIMVLANPFCVADVGFLLSTFATLGIILLTAPINIALCKHLPTRRIPRIAVSAVYMSAAQSVAAILFTLPIVVYFFGRVSLISPVSNIAFFVISNLILCGGAIAALLFTAFPFRFLAYPIFLVVGLLAKFMIWLTHIMATIPFAAVTVTRSYISLWLCLAMLLIAAAIFIRKNGSLVRLASLLSVILLLVGMLSYNVLDTGVTRVTAIDAGNGIAVVVHRGSRAVVIGCSEDKYTASSVERFLKQQAIREVDMLILPTPQKIYSGGALSMLRDVEPAILMLKDGGEYTRALSALKLEHTKKINMAGAEIRIWDGLTINTYDSGSVFLHIGQTVIAIPAAGEDMSGFSDNADLIICTAAVPLNASAEKVVVCGDKDRAYIGASRLSMNGIRTYATGGDGSITAMTRGGGDITLRREKDA